MIKGANMKLSKQFKGFMTFVREHGVVGLAVGLAIGTQVGVVVKTIVEGLVNPVVAFILGSTASLESAHWVVVYDWYGRTLDFKWGQVLSALITLLAVSAVIYYAVHGLRLDKLDKKKD